MKRGWWVMERRGEGWWIRGIGKEMGLVGEGGKERGWWEKESGGGG